MKKQSLDDRIICRNRKARHAFELVETFECGIVLTGPEVKSLRAKNVSLDEAFGRIDGNELWLIGCHISPYKYSSISAHDPIRRRKLLIHRRELSKLKPSLILKGLTLVPLDMHFNDRGIAKVTLAVAKGKSHRDKRHDLKEREDKREIERATRRGR